MKYPRGHAWLPSSIKNIELRNVVVLKSSLVSKRGFVFDICQCEIDSIDATLLKLKIDLHKFSKTIKFSKIPFKKDKYN